MGLLLSSLFGRGPRGGSPAHDHEEDANQNHEPERPAAEPHRDTEDEDSSVEAQGNHEFSQALVHAETGPPVDIEQSFLEDAKAHLDTIEKEYKKMFELRVDIDKLLKGFKQRLHVEEKTQLSVCFKHLRGLVGDYETLQLSREGQLCIIIGEDACEGAKEAVEKFNLMLQRCSEYPEKQSEVEAIIEREIVALERDSVQTQATLDAQQRARKQLSALREWGEWIQSHIKETKSSSKYLSGQNVTGVKKTLRED
jgi:hypothetical protein